MTDRVPQNTEKKWEVYDQILIEVAAELSGEDFETQVAWTPELLAVKESVMKQFKDKPHVTMDFVN